MVGTFVEELISPIPAFLVLIPTGAVVRAQEMSLWAIPGLAILCGLGRVLGGSVLYWLAYHLEKALLGPRRILGLNHNDVTRLSRRLGSQKKAWRVWTVLMLLHILPVFPGILLSAGSGFIKIPYVIYATATFIGSIINAVAYIWVGYMGIEVAKQLDQIGILTNIATLAALIALGAWLYNRWRRLQARAARQEAPNSVQHINHDKANNHK